MIYKGTDIDFQPGDVILFRYGFIWHELERYLSAINRAFTGSYYNHGGIVVKSNDMLLINESVGKGVISRPLVLNLEREKIKLIVLRSRVKQGIDEVCKRAVIKQGTPYDYAAFVFYQPVYRVFKKWLGPTGARAEKTMGCIEYMAWCYSRPQWYLYTAAEMTKDYMFEIIYQEK
jgi:hypothetical protein